MSATQDELDLDHFIRLSRRGKHKGASSGERNAWNLMQAIAANSQNLDESAICGARSFLLLAHTTPWIADEMIS